MKKRIISLLFAAMLIVTASACGKTEPVQTAPAASEEEQPEAEEPAEPQEEVLQAEPETEQELILPVNTVQSDAPQLIRNEKSYYEYDQEGNVLMFSGKFEGITLAEESSAQYPALAEELETAWDKARNEADESAYQSQLDAQNQYDEMKSGNEDMSLFRNYTDERKVQVTRCDDKVLSICQSNFSDYGGAHGIYGNTGETYSVQDGKKLLLSDVIKDPEGFADLVTEKIETDYPEVFEDSIDVEDTKNIIRTDITGNAETWILDPEGIQFFFNPYEIAPYALGEQIVKVTTREAPELFAEEYLPEPGISTVTGTPNRTEFRTDLDGDGQVDHFRLSEVWSTYGENDEEYYVSGLQVVLEEDKEIPLFESDEIFDFEAYLARFPNGKNYLLIDSSEMNDYHGLYIVDATDKTFSKVDSYWVSPEYMGYDADTETSREYLMTDPANILLTKHFDRFSTFQAGGRHILDENGNFTPADFFAVIPESSREYYNLKSVVDLTLDVVNEAGEVLEEGAVIPSGTSFELYRTPYDEDENYVDAVLSDGRMARLRYDADASDGRKINGIEESDAFEALYYAG